MHYLQAAGLLGISDVEAELDNDHSKRTEGQGLIGRSFNQHKGLGAKGPTKHQVRFLGE